MHPRSQPGAWEQMSRADATSSLHEATSSPSEELAPGSHKLLVVSRLQVSISVDLASTFFARLSHCLHVSGRAWKSQIFLISLELAKEKKPSSWKLLGTGTVVSPFHLSTHSHQRHPQVSHFPVVTDYHALCGFKQRQFTLSHFWRLEV